MSRRGDCAEGGRTNMHWKGVALNRHFVNHRSKKKWFVYLSRERNESESQCGGKNDGER